MTEPDIFIPLTLFIRRKSPIILKKAINPLKISDIVHAFSAFMIAPSAVTSENTNENIVFEPLGFRKIKAVSPQ